MIYYVDNVTKCHLQHASYHTLWFILQNNVINTLYYIFIFYIIMFLSFLTKHINVHTFKHKTFLVPYILFRSFFHIIKQNFKCFSMNFYWHHKSYFRNIFKAKENIHDIGVVVSLLHLLLPHPEYIIIFIGRNEEENIYWIKVL